MISEWPALVVSLVSCFKADSNFKQLRDLVLCKSKCALFDTFGFFRFVLCPAFASNLYVQSWTDLYRFDRILHWPDLGTGRRDESFLPEEVSFEVLGRANGLSKAYALQPSSQYIPVLCLETLSPFRNRPQKFGHLAMEDACSVLFLCHPVPLYHIVPDLRQCTCWNMGLCGVIAGWIRILAGRHSPFLQGALGRGVSSE